MNGFKLIADFIVRCEHCGKEIETGIVTITNHWAECFGKGFTEAMIKAREEKGKPLTMYDVEIVRQNHKV